MIRYTIALLILIFCLAQSSFAADEQVVNFEDDIKPIFRQHCLICHGNDTQEADINLQSHGSVMKGGSGGKIVVPGRSSQSLLYQAIINPDDGARMPPDSPPLADEKIALIKTWIDSGLRASKNSNSLVKARDITFVPAQNAGQKPGNPAMPSSLPEISVPSLTRQMAVLAMDASPWSPVMVASGYENLRVLNSVTEEEIGRIAYPEGEPHVIRFSRDGSLLMVAGGRPVESGTVVLYDVATGERKVEVGDEIDTVIAADLSPDQTMVALGGSGRVVKIYSTADGSLLHKLEKHTEWITDIAFSPDGRTLASADRAGGIHLWDPDVGKIRLTLAEHKDAVRAIDWRSDSKVLASVGEDGLIVWWDVTDGFPVSQVAGAHPRVRPPGTYGTIPNGVLSARFDQTGRLATTGRDKKLRVWDPKGKALSDYNVETGIPLSCCFSSDGQHVICGDSAGQIHFFDFNNK
ncbi:c-type cytochrome domain-containing protein [Calycomorphotria hydatis]|uniref:WD domain, G-beta repeat n=1 Tax=Calycomorphotria hydatis TaxID=2528027 RepID=A0A517T995_9PLAN|nr:c-type cytochrome domain-containing protein [Calycomorphotria hydatis]QDT64937.1 WD domain, G-beta repeat [Calycomorphotria hydatis]